MAVTDFTTVPRFGFATVARMGVDSPETEADESDRLSRAKRMAKMLAGLGDDGIAIVNGLFGDTLDHRGSRSATRMTIRAGYTSLPLERDTPRHVLADHVPDASPRITILVHGLMSTESIWGFRNDASTTYGTLLAEDHDMTVLTLRYNTGRHISTNGRQFAHLLNMLMRAWPVRVTEINLIGHSMGGLVVRSACHYARAQVPIGRRFPIGRRWTNKVRRVVLIGVPNDGAGLEAFVNSTSAALWALPLAPARLFGLGLDQRSAGIKDLRFGAIHDDDWVEQDPATRHRIHRHRPHRLRRAAHLVIAGTVTADRDHPLARVIGDSLVTSPSAAGLVDDGELFPDAEIQVFPKLTHNALAHRRNVYEAIANWW